MAANRKKIVKWAIFIIAAVLIISACCVFAYLIFHQDAISSVKPQSTLNETVKTDAWRDKSEAVSTPVTPSEQETVNSETTPSTTDSEYPPMFSDNENITPEVRNAVRERVESEWTEAFGEYYQVLGFETSGVVFSETEGVSNLEFHMNMITQNFYKDPDTIPYIKDLKDSGSPNYQQLYDEYNAPMDNNFHMKAVVGADGSVELFANNSPHEVDFQPVQASDYILQ